MNIPESKNPIVSAEIVGSDVDYADYSKQPDGVIRGNLGYIMGRSELTEFAKCPSRWRKGYKDEEGSEATEWGSLIDCLALAPNSLDAKVAICPETYPDSKTGEPKPWTFAANYCKAWKAKNEGKQIVKHDVFDKANGAIGALLVDDEIQSLIACSQTQVMVAGKYVDGETGLEVVLRGLIDMVPDKSHLRFGKSLADLKTCNDASAFAWGRAVFDRGYHIQAALYLDLYTAATGEDRLEFLHVVQESFKPWQPARRIVSTEFVELGRMAYVSALRRYCKCLSDGIWPGYDQEDQLIQGWALTQPEQWMIGR